MVGSKAAKKQNQQQTKEFNVWFGLYYVHKQIIAIDAILIK